MTAASARNRLAEFRARSTIDPAELDALWEALEPASLDDLWGSWEGAELATGHPLSKLLGKVRWVGKRFGGPLDVQPLVCRAPDGSLFSNLELGKGEASAWMVAFRGESTATMVYDGTATFDHFKKIDDRTLMGIMNGKNVLHEGRHFYFVLERASAPFVLGPPPARP
ncbi:DUF4334 domain-containing protein [Hyalangium rubrum]|uniref:DUF4334 domain-containing protein n=1 Tax=Hyalangium rubrum TaxID=3103134 RepID=A0ABU5H1F5_9BACT|nr:DUF4334 domain-containing protein [Hyalangium sp. s54d21]MDY7226573.1 DUF4334 domain-containing protein [Hyalangium sp. s54d21]